MRASTLVQATADVVTILSLRRGDVYKRLEESSYGAEKWSLQFGVVTDVMHNGEDAVISALEFPQDWSGAPTPKLKTYGTGADLKLFAAQPEEVREHFRDLLEGSRREVAKARDAWEKAAQIDGQIQATIGSFSTDLELSAALTGVPALEAPAGDDDSAPAADEDPAETVADF